MPNPSAPLRIFVAMPGSTMGEAASWSNIAEIKSSLLQPVADQIEQRTGRKTDLVIEKDKISTGGIYGSMYKEAVDADVYIADLTAANPNVYLELGVRWALKDGVTIPISQNVGDVRFNVSGTRVIPYGPMPGALEQATQQITEAAVDGLMHPDRIDSPVRDSLRLVAVTRQNWDELKAEVERLKDERAEDLVAAARAATTPSDRIELLQTAITRNPANVQAHVDLGVEQRKAGKYSAAADVLRSATQLDQDNPTAWRELGVAHSKNGDLDQAVTALERAARLDERDAETWSNLGGALRRAARQDGTARFDLLKLQRAKDAYDRAAKLSGNDTYPLMNAARIGLLLGAGAPETRAAALNVFDDLRLLTEFAVRDTNYEDPWKLFDFADALMLTGRVDAAIEKARQAITLIPPENLASYLSSALEPLEDLGACLGLADQLVGNVTALMGEYRDALASVCS